MKDKSQYTLTLEKTQFAFLAEIAKKYKLPDESKALRCLINYTIEHADQQATIFGDIRCLDC